MFIYLGFIYTFVSIELARWWSFSLKWVDFKRFNYLNEALEIYLIDNKKLFLVDIIILA